VKLNQTFETIYAGDLKTNGIDHYDLADAIIVDARPENVIANSEVEKIENLDTLMDLKAVDAIIYMDVYVDDADEAVEMIYITKVIPVYVPETTDALTVVSDITITKVAANGTALITVQKNDTTNTQVQVEVRATVGETIKAGTYKFNDATGKLAK